MYSKEINVTAIDAETGKLIARFSGPATMLPNRIEPGMELVIENNDWRVVQANPSTAEQFIRMGTLDLLLQKVENPQIGKSQTGRQQIHVALVDADTNMIFGQMLSFADEMPPVFEANQISLNLEGAPWEVIKAIPPTAAEYTKSGRITLVLKKITHMPLDKVLASLPTICETIPDVQPINIEKDTSYMAGVDQSILSKEERAAGENVFIRPVTQEPMGNIFRIHEDYWRQIEFIGTGYEEAIKAERADIRAIFQNHSVQNNGVWGFKKVHIRSRINNPVRHMFAYKTLLSLLPKGSHLYRGIGFGGPGSQEADGLIENGFAIQVGPVVIFGQHDGTTVKVMCLYDFGEPTIPSETVASFLNEVMNSGKIYLVDWVKEFVLLPKLDNLQNYLQNHFY